MSLPRFLSSNRTLDPDRASLQSGRPPTYASNITTPPAYAGTHGDRVRAWSASVPSPSALSAPDSETLLDETEPSLSDTVSVADADTEGTNPTGPRYS
jgi:hypothetical protein